ncbi:AP-5 complex subunit beta-1 isoform X2 [Rhinoderma darwinii]|uniref:AP-5 complex subunit beta-1 isoform X2 n=1 Tax=Rhinoderma darwinii TaxID=43563 RepID=UPI003F67A436
MAERSNSSWIRNVASFSSNPKSFLLNTAVEGFVDDLLKDLKSEGLSEQTKVSMLNLFLEFPTLLCPDQTSGEVTTEILLNILQQMSPSLKNTTLRCHLLLAIETVLITTDNFNWNCKTAQELASLLMHVVSDVNDKKQGAANRPLRVVACECLRELENCYPGLLSQRLEQLYTLQQQEVTGVHQSYTILYSIALKNAIQLLAQKDGPSHGALKQMLMSNDSFLWNATKDMRELRAASDIDIQDRSRLYYVLLTNVSSDKLGKILNMSPTGGPTKARSLSSIMTESENFSTLLTIQNTEKTILHLCPVLDPAKILPTYAEASTDESKESGCTVEEYFRHLADHRSTLLTLKYQMTFKGDVEEKYQKLFCIILQFDLTDGSYEPIGDIDVPCLYIGRTAPVVTVNLVPKDPHPSYLVVNATFSTQDGLTYHTRLDPLPVTFPELFVPFPLPASCQLDARCHLFDKLWHALNSDDLKDHEESIFCYKMSESSLRDVVVFHFAKYVVSHHAHQYKIGIVLPPRSHILMCAQIQDDTAQFQIRTDNWKLLPYMNAHLLDVSNKT